MGSVITLRSVLGPVFASLLLTQFASPARAQTPLPIGADGFAGGRHTAFATPAAARVVAGSAVELAHTEPVLSGSDRHERISGELFGSFALHPAVSVGASALARLGIHHGARSQRGAALGSALQARARHAVLNERLHVGADLRVLFPPAESPARGFRATSPELRALATSVWAATTLALNLGYRVDRTPRALADPGTVSDEGLLLASASSSDAFLLALAASRAWLGCTWLVEWSYDVGLGADAPKASASPMRFEASLQRMALTHLAFGVFFGVSPSARPAFTSDPLVRIEPRVWVGANLAFIFDPEEEPAPATEQPAQTQQPAPANVAETAPSPAEPALPDGQIRGRVRSLKGPALKAEIEILPLGLHAQSSADGSFAIDVAPGDYQVTVHAKGHIPQTRTATVEQNGVTILVIDLERSRP